MEAMSDNKETWTVFGGEESVKFPFFESEDGTIVALWHMDREYLVELIFQFDTLTVEDEAKAHSPNEVKPFASIRVTSI